MRWGKKLFHLFDLPICRLYPTTIDMFNRFYRYQPGGYNYRDRLYGSHPSRYHGYNYSYGLDSYDWNRNNNYPYRSRYGRNRRREDYWYDYPSWYNDYMNRGRGRTVSPRREGKQPTKNSLIICRQYPIQFQIRKSIHRSYFFIIMK